MAFTQYSLAFSILVLSLITLIASAIGYENAPKPKLNTPLPHDDHPTTIAVQGIIYCKLLGSKLIPLKGGLARITCLGMDKYGYESAPFSTLSHPTDANGYFLATLSPSQLNLREPMKIRECKAFLESSPLENCKIPTDVNKGKNGALLSAYRLLSNKNIKLYSVPPFVYTTTTATSF